MAEIAQTVILVRHGEKADPSDRDTPLSAAGLARAQVLKACLTGAGVRRVITSEFKRTQQTAQPTADAANLPLKKVPGQTTDDVRAAILEAGPDATVLVVGHSNTVHDLAVAFGDPDPPPIDDAVFDVMVVVHLGGPRPRIVHGRYGARSGG
jgi:broad specificity phosphatase PhoE